MQIQIYWEDLTEEKQNELLEVLGDNNNYDIFPIATIVIDDDDVE